MMDINEFKVYGEILVNQLSYLIVSNIQLKEVTKEEFDSFIEDYPTHLRIVSVTEKYTYNTLYFDQKILSYDSLDPSTSKIKCQMMAQITGCSCCNNKRYFICDKSINEIRELLECASVVSKW